MEIDYLSQKERRAPTGFRSQINRMLVAIMYWIVNTVKLAAMKSIRALKFITLEKYFSHRPGPGFFVPIQSWVRDCLSNNDIIDIDRCTFQSFQDIIKYSNKKNSISWKTFLKWWWWIKKDFLCFYEQEKWHCLNVKCH